ncbi:unnamed protein product, partial [Scytosiphon promiscuus]
GAQQHVQGTIDQVMKRKRSEPRAQSTHDVRVTAVAAAAASLLSPRMMVGASGLFVCDSGGWDLTPSEAYAWSYAPPQGCTCQETGVPLADCKIFDCGCVCDLAAGQCDINCCCDSECSQSELERFAELDACLDEGPADEVVTTCYSTADNLDSINPRFPLTGGGAAQGAVDGLLCVQYDNSASRGEFYEDPGTLPTSIFGDSGASEYSYHDHLAASATSATTETDAYFDKGDRIPAAFEDEGGGTTAAFGGYFPLPVGDDSGRCNEANFMGFDIPVPATVGKENACSREVENLESQCSSVFSWERFSSQLMAGTDGTVAPASVIIAGEYIPVEISSTTWRDWDTGRETDFAEVNCGAFYIDGTAAGSTSSCIMGGGDGDTILSAANPVEGCKNALASICYTVVHDGEGSVTAVTAAVVLTDIPPGPNGGNSSAVSAQQFSVEFRLDETSDAYSEMTRSQDLGNLVEREKSGNPGYLPGFPVIGGRLESSGDNEYIAAGGSAGTGGLELMAGTERGCDNVGTTPVEFAYDGFGCCVLPLTREALAEHCTGSGPHVDPNTGFTPLAFLNTSSSVAYLGSYGNADPLDMSQWVELPFSSSADTASWDDESGVCSSMVSTLEYRILYATVGSKANPQ